MRYKAASLANLVQYCIDYRSHSAGKILHAHIIRIGLSSDTFLNNRLIELYSKCRQIITACILFDIMPHRNAYSCHAIMSACCKANELEKAKQLLNETSERDAISFNTLISALVNNGCEKNALEVYYKMNSEGFLPTRFTLASVLRACSGLGDVGVGRECHCGAIKMGLDKNVYVGNALLSLYGKCGSVDDAVQIFEEFEGPNEVSFTAMMGVLTNSGKVKEAFNMFKLMQRYGIRIDSVSLSSVLGVCNRKSEVLDNVDKNAWFNHTLCGIELHGLTIKLGFESDIHLSNSLLNMYSKNGDMNSAEKIFATLPEVAVVAWNVMIGGYGQICQAEKALEYMQRMHCQGFQPNEVTYINMLAACMKSGDVELGHQILDRLVCPSLSSWNVVISGYSHNGNYENAISLFREMLFKHVQPDRTTLAITLDSCAGLGILNSGKQIHAASFKLLLDTNIYVASGLIGLYSKCNKVEVAKMVFERMPVLDVVCWNSMISGLSLNFLDTQAFFLYKEMLGKGELPSQFTYTTVLSSCAKVMSLSQGMQVNAQLVKDGHMNDVCVGCALINMYSKCGYVDVARLFFNKMSCRNSVTWNEMIHGYAQNGRGYEAVFLFEDMIRSGEKLDEITFVAVLTACSHSALVDFGIKIFNSMQQNHGVKPLLEHCTCIIDSLSRAGRFDEVEVLLDEMPYKEEPIIWEALLSSCRVHANTVLARRAAEELFRLEPENAAPYVLLANMYSSLGCWNEAKKIRNMMIEREVVKAPGYSCIEDNSRVQINIVDNNSMMDDDEFEASRIKFSSLSG